MRNVVSRSLFTFFPLATSLSLLSGCGSPAPDDSMVASTQSSLTHSTTDIPALRTLGTGWTEIAPGVAEKRQGVAILHAAFSPAGQQWMRQQYLQALRKQEEEYARNPLPVLAQHMDALRQALREVDARTLSIGPASPEVSSMASADFTGTELCKSDSGGAVFSVYTMTRWQADFPLFGEAAAVAGGDSKWDGRTSLSGVASTSATVRGAYGAPIPGFRGHQVSGYDPAGKSVYFGAAYALSCTVPYVPPPSTICTHPGSIECIDTCGNEYCYYGSSCPPPRRGGAGCYRAD